MSEKKENDFFDRPHVIKNILLVFYICCALLFVVDFVLLFSDVLGYRKLYTEIEGVPAFYAIYGFVACVLLVVMAVKIRTWVMRDENYYGEHDEQIEQADEKS